MTYRARFGFEEGSLSSPFHKCLKQAFPGPFALLPFVVSESREIRQGEA